MTTPSATPRRPSAFEAAEEAMDLTARRLFPVNFERWIVLGFVAFLDQCGRGGLPGGGGNWVPSDTEQTGRVTSWVTSHVGLVVLLAAAVLAVVVAFAALVLWINSRGVFMYIDDVATGRAEIARPWREHAEKAGSFFAWRFGINMAALAGALLVAAVALLILLPGRGGEPSPLAIVLTILGLGLPVLAVAIVLVLLTIALRDFVAPLQLREGLACGPALRLFLDLLRAHPGAFAFYLVLKIAFGLVTFAAMMLVCCVTCFCGLLPVVCQTLLQPLFYFERAWSLCLLGQMGYGMPGLVAAAEMLTTRPEVFSSETPEKGGGEAPAPE
jgi:hypothetical protein